MIAVARRESDELRETIRAIVERGTGGLQFRAFDLAEIDAIPGFVKDLRDEFGAIYALSITQESAPRGCWRRCTTARSRRCCAWIAAAEPKVRRIAFDNAFAPSAMNSLGTVGSSPRETRLSVSAKLRSFRL